MPRRVSGCDVTTEVASFRLAGEFELNIDNIIEVDC